MTHETPVNENFFIRQRDLLPPEKTVAKILVVGAGAIGSQVVMCLAKMGFKDITVFDDDTVSEENISCQWYGPKDIGQRKSQALKERVADMTGAMIQNMNERFNEESADQGYNIVVSAVDSMKSRTYIWNRAKNFFKLTHYIDPRMSAEEGSIYTINTLDLDEMAKYEKTIFPDDEGVSEPCTAKATMYCSMLLAGQVAKQIKDIVVGETPARTILWSVKANDIHFFK